MVVRVKYPALLNTQDLVTVAEDQVKLESPDEKSPVTLKEISVPLQRPPPRANVAALGMKKVIVSPVCVAAMCCTLKLLLALFQVVTKELKSVVPEI